MTTKAMDCELFAERLMSYLENETDDATRQAVERHARSCAECGALLDDIREIRVSAANLPELRPSRDLWQGIEARIQAAVIPIGQKPDGADTADMGRGIWDRRWMRYGALAASLVVAAGVGYLASGLRASDTTLGVARDTGIISASEVLPADTTLRAVARVPAAPGSPQAAPVRTPAVSSRQPADSVDQMPAVRLVLAALSADYDREIARLRSVINERRNQLDPVTVAIIEKNLTVIDSAIVECKLAIAQDPASRFLIESLNQSLQTKVELMRIAALLPNRT